jgi:hypothetical protein
MGSARGMFPAVATVFQDVFLGDSVQSACGMFSATSGNNDMYAGHTSTDPIKSVSQFP